MRTPWYWNSVDTWINRETGEQTTEIPEEERLKFLLDEWEDFASRGLWEAHIAEKLIKVLKAKLNES